MLVHIRCIGQGQIYPQIFSILRARLAHGYKPVASEPLTVTSTLCAIACATNRSAGQSHVAQVAVNRSRTQNARRLGRDQLRMNADTLPSESPSPSTTASARSVFAYRAPIAEVSLKCITDVREMTRKIADSARRPMSFLIIPSAGYSWLGRQRGFSKQHGYRLDCRCGGNIAPQPYPGFY